MVFSLFSSHIHLLIPAFYPIFEKRTKKGEDASALRLIAFLSLSKFGIPVKTDRLIIPRNSFFIRLIRIIRHGGEVDNRQRCFSQHSVPVSDPFWDQ